MDDPPPANRGLRFPSAPAPVPVGLAAAPAPLHPLALAAAPFDLVAPDTADVDAAEPQALKRPQLPTQDVRISDSSEDALPNDISQNPRIVWETPPVFDPMEQRLPAEAVLTGNLHATFSPKIYILITIAKLVLSDRELLELVDFNHQLVVIMDSPELKPFFSHLDVVVHNLDRLPRKTHVLLLPFQIQNLLVKYYSRNRLNTQRGKKKACLSIL